MPNHFRIKAPSGLRTRGAGCTWGKAVSVATVRPGYRAWGVEPPFPDTQGFGVGRATYNRWVNASISPLLDGLNDIQTEAVLHTEGPVLIVAGAGSGKTRALTHRIAYLIREHDVSPGAILAITFTNKAAREMADRVEGLLGGRVAKGMWILTFHSTCSRILRREHTHLGVPSSFTIYDDGDTERLIAGILKDLDLDPKRFPTKAMAAGIGRAKDQVQSADDYARNADNFYEETIAKVYSEYERRKRAAGALDFDDLISETVRLFDDHPEVLQHYQERFRYVLVDEYQDTNRAQYRLVNQLAAKYRNVCVVGDADQGVYSWRGATIKNILDFERDYQDAAVFLMEQNYRSTQNILEIANALIEHNVQRKPKSLWTEAGNGDLTVQYRAEDEHDEAFFVADEIERLRQSEGYRYRDVAIFYRTNAQSRVIEDVLMRVGSPYRVFGGVRFYQRKEIKDVLGYLRLLLNPQDVIAFRRVVNMPKRGIGDATVATLESFARDEEISVTDACRRVDEISTLQSRAKGSVFGFVQVMDALQHHMEDGAGPARMVECAGQESGYLTELEEDRTVEAQGRIENLQELAGVAAEILAREPDTDLAGFLEQVSLVSDQDEYDEDESVVTLMTLHIAKGLEFPVVFMVGMEDGIFPHYRSMTDTAALEEERRLAYVGITRAQKRLYLCHAWSRTLFGQTQYNPPSRFLAELPQQLMELKEHESRSRPRRDGRPAARIEKERNAGHSVIGLPGTSGSVDVPNEWVAPKPAGVAKQPAIGIDAGDTVIHDRWGEGVVLTVSGMGDDAEATITFSDVGEKRVLLAYAPLKKVG
jgi:DNA helicase-2/ATP-dependent DNA helicase PcrA